LVAFRVVRHAVIIRRSRHRSRLLGLFSTQMSLDPMNAPPRPNECSPSTQCSPKFLTETVILPRPSGVLDVMSSANSSPRAEGASPHFPRRGDAVSAVTRTNLQLNSESRMHICDEQGTSWSWKEDAISEAAVHRPKCPKPTSDLNLRPCFRPT
jgi:hypothetical protein